MHAHYDSGDVDLHQNLDVRPCESSIYHVPSFLIKLFEIIDSPSTDQIVEWTHPDGESFVIKSANKFAEVILPQYFKHSNFSSFIRQLNMYDFHKSRKKGGSDQVFNHPFFRKGHRNLLS